MTRTVANFLAGASAGGGNAARVCLVGGAATRRRPGFEGTKIAVLSSSATRSCVRDGATARRTRRERGALSCVRESGLRTLQRGREGGRFPRPIAFCTLRRAPRNSVQTASETYLERTVNSCPNAGSRVRCVGLTWLSLVPCAVLLRRHPS